MQRCAGVGAPMVVDEELNELKREFLDEALEKVTEMQAALDRLAERESLDRLAYLAHQLKGSGGSYGYQRISTDAAELEKVVESMAGGGATQEEKIQQYVLNLRGEIDRAARELQ
ncbi:MAG TPA: Hpt domain-containing protein [Thermoanaerobaculia bacterium]|nr:Hpt domain-containing protein [Thermoanaerobaculia bacterium]